jgi:hypothetical protein
VTKYYNLAGMRVAMQNETGTGHFASDHLSSTSIIMKSDGVLIGEQ